MKVGIIGLGRMGEGMSRRLMKNGHEVWGFRRNLKKAEEAYENGHVSGIAYTLKQLVEVVTGSHPSMERSQVKQCIHLQSL